MELKRINVIVPKEAHDVLDQYQRQHGHRTRDNAMADLLLEFKRMKAEK